MSHTLESVILTAKQMENDKQKKAEKEKEEMKEKQKRVNQGKLEIFKGLPIEVQEGIIYHLIQKRSKRWGPAGPRTNKQIELDEELFGHFREILTKDYYKSLQTKKAIEKIQKELEINLKKKKNEEAVARIKEIEDFLGIPILAGIKPLTNQERKSLEDYMKEIGEENIAGAGAGRTKNMHAKTLKNIEKAEKNALEKAKQNAARAQIEEIEAYIARPTSSSNEKELQEEFARIEAEEKKKNRKKLLFINKTQKMAKQLGMSKESTYKNVMNRIANNLGMKRGLPPRNYKKAYQAKKQMEQIEAYLSAPTTNTTRKKGGKHRTMRKRNKSRQTRRRRV